MTLATVTLDYPADQLVQILNGFKFGTYKLCYINYGDDMYIADDCPLPPSYQK